MSHQVTVYTDSTAKTFSATARQTDGARIDKVNAQQQALGFTITNIANNIGKVDADIVKANVEQLMVTLGYTKVLRDNL